MASDELMESRKRAQNTHRALHQTFGLRSDAVGLDSAGPSRNKGNLHEDFE